MTLVAFLEDLQNQACEAPVTEAWSCLLQRNGGTMHGLGLRV